MKKPTPIAFNKPHMAKGDVLNPNPPQESPSDAVSSRTGVNTPELIRLSNALNDIVSVVTDKLIQSQSELKRISLYDTKATPAPIPASECVADEFENIYTKMKYLNSLADDLQAHIATII